MLKTIKTLCTSVEIINIPKEARDIVDSFTCAHEDDLFLLLIVTRS